MNTQELLQERGQTHGDFTDNSRVSQELKATLHCENADLTDIEREAIDMICHKLARIVCGNPHFKDHWDDIAGYAMLVVDRLKKTPGATDVKQEYIVIGDKDPYNT
jgi:hypothetical protein